LISVCGNLAKRRPQIALNSIEYKSYYFQKKSLIICCNVQREQSLIFQGDFAMGRSFKDEKQKYNFRGSKIAYMTSEREDGVYYRRAKWEKKDGERTMVRNILKTGRYDLLEKDDE
jgi:hypothetical protein